MVMYQPFYAHHALGLAVFTVALWVICCTIGVFNRRRRADDPATLKKNRANLRWAAAVYFAVLGQLVAENYSQAYDPPHHTSLRTQIIIGFGIVGPCLLGLQLWLDKEPRKPKSAEQEKPYYGRD